MYRSVFLIHFNACTFLALESCCGPI